MDLLLSTLLGIEKGDGSELSAPVLLSYSAMKTAFILSEIASNASILPYTEMYHMNLGWLSIARALSKVIDFAVAFAVGYASDALSSPFGRRHPFILFGGMLSAAFMYLLVSPPKTLILPETINDTDTESPCDDERDADCAAVLSCIETNIAVGLLPGQSSEIQLQASTAEEQNNTLLVPYFFLVFSLRYSLGHTVAHIPYDALGQELIKVSDQRARLFAGKAIAASLGNLIGTVVNGLLASKYSDNMYYQALVLNYFAIVIQLLCMLVVIGVVREPLVVQKHEAQDKPPKQPTFNQILLRMRVNSAYRNYISFRISQAAGFFIHNSPFIFWIKYVLKFENSTLAHAVMGLIFFPSTFMAMPLTVIAMRRYGKQRCLVALSTVMATELLITAALPYSILRGANYYALHSVFMGIAQAALFTIPESLLADIMDYDELLHGDRKEGSFVVMDLNVVQLMDVLGGVLPGVVLSLWGYINNGGCECGCGVPCPILHLRWSCPGDIGYACDSSLRTSNQLFFGRRDRTPPCTLQEESVQTAIIIIAFIVPAFMYLLTAMLACQAPITPAMQLEIQEQLKLVFEGGIAFDPVCLVKLPQIRNRHEGHISETTESNAVDVRYPTKIKQGLRRWMLSTLTCSARASRRAMSSDRVSSSSLQVELVVRSSGSSVAADATRLRKPAFCPR